ncbi:MAG: 2Fe-2S iron-sulfur cluster binding domain-containing protein, partial [Desulfovermiculus sp.]|nr:2Fe-2S iron-sulfur cluster binding domain-containing protein [Desulfovermiculus sp.]
MDVNCLLIASTFSAGWDLSFPAGLLESFMPDSTVTIVLTLNGQNREFTFQAQTSALALLRDKARLTSVKEGCGIGECGTCTILVDGRAVNACLLLAAQLDQTQVFTVEGLKENKDFRSLQESFMNNHAVQCGFCTPGLLISSYALGRQNP